MKRFVMIGLVFAVLGVVMSNIMLGKKPTDVVPDVSAIKNIEVPEIPSVFSRLTSVFSSGGSDSDSGSSSDFDVDGENTTRSKDAVSVYKWQDSNGNWHFDDKPPAGLATEEVVIEVDNVLEMEMPKLPDPEPSSTPPEVELGSPYSPEGVKDLMEKARGVQGTLEDRTSEQQRVLDSL